VKSAVALCVDAIVDAVAFIGFSFFVQLCLNLEKLSSDCNHSALQNDNFISRDFFGIFQKP